MWTSRHRFLREYEPAPSSRAAAYLVSLVEETVDPFARLVTLGGEEGTASQTKLLELVRARGRGNLLRAAAADAPRSLLDEDLLMKLLRRPGMSREVRLVLLDMLGSTRLEVDGLRPYDEEDVEWRSRKSDKEADDMPPPMYGGAGRDESLLEDALRFVSS